MILYDACPLCESEGVAPERDRWMRCSLCGHSFTSGYHSPSELTALLSKTPECQMVGYRHEDFRMPCSRIVERVAAYCPNGAWLDVGFGNAALLLTAEEFGYSTLGVDAREQNCQQLREIGLYNWSGDFMAFPAKCAWNVVSLCDVLEHMPYPKAALRKARQLLAEDGILLVSCPNMDAPSAQLLDAAGLNPYWDEVEHYHNFGRARLYALLEECGFQPISYAVSERYRLGMEVIARAI